MQHLLGYFAQYGYWVVVLILLLENMGLPVPGETALLIGSALAAKHQLRIGYLIAFAIPAAMVGDNLGFAAGRWGGRRLLDRYRALFHISPVLISKAEELIRKHGAPIIFMGRFVAGLRILNGPMAGTLGMRWGLFAVFDCLGAATWVCVIAGLGYLFGSRLDRLAHVLGRTGLILTVAVAAAVVVLWKTSRCRELARGTSK